MMPYQEFHCPRCGAPGNVQFGQASYSCTCRLGTYGQLHTPPLIMDEYMVRHIVRDELERQQLGKDAPR